MVRRSKHTKGEPARSHTLRLRDATWKELQHESVERAMTISDIIEEALQGRFIKVIRPGDKK